MPRSSIRLSIGWPVDNQSERARGLAVTIPPVKLALPGSGRNGGAFRPCDINQECKMCTDGVCDTIKIRSAVRRPTRSKAGDSSNVVIIIYQPTREREKERERERDARCFSNCGAVSLRDDEFRDQ